MCHYKLSLIAKAEVSMRRNIVYFRRFVDTDNGLLSISGLWRIIRPIAGLRVLTTGLFYARQIKFDATYILTAPF